jgi:hypothetical protein
MSAFFEVTCTCTVRCTICGYVNWKSFVGKPLRKSCRATLPSQSYSHHRRNPNLFNNVETAQDCTVYSLRGCTVYILVHVWKLNAATCASADFHHFCLCEKVCQTVGGVLGVPIPTRGIHCGTLYMYVLCAAKYCTMYILLHV